MEGGAVLAWQRSKRASTSVIRENGDKREREKRSEKEGDAVEHASIVSRGAVIRNEQSRGKAAGAALHRNSRGGQENLLSPRRRCHRSAKRPAC